MISISASRRVAVLMTSLSGSPPQSRIKDGTVSRYEVVPAGFSLDSCSVH